MTCSCLKESLSIVLPSTFQIKANHNKLECCNRDHSHLVYSTVWEGSATNWFSLLQRNAIPAAVQFTHML